MEKKKECPQCKSFHKNSTKLCQNCYCTHKKYGTFDPKEWYRNCDSCEGVFKNKLHNAKYCPECRIKYNLVYQKYSKKKKNTGETRFKRKNGEGTITKSGYVNITRVCHPNSGINGKIQEHTFIMSENIGRAIRKNESVHHLNGIRDDNRIENLELWSKSQPSGQRVKDKIEWCKEFLREYNYVVTKE